MWLPALSWANPMAHTGFIRKLLLHYQHKPFPIPVMLQWLLHWLLLILVILCPVYLGYLVLGYLVTWCIWGIWCTWPTPSQSWHPPPAGTLRLGQCPANWGTSTALEVALQVMVLCRWWIPRTSHHATKANHCEPRLQVTCGIASFCSDLLCSEEHSCILAIASPSSGVLLAESLEGSAQCVCVCGPSEKT